MKHYAQRDIRALGQRYADHVSAMTAEGLHAKSAIAVELAWRDERIAALESERAENATLRDQYKGAEDALYADGFIFIDGEWKR